MEKYWVDINGDSESFWEHEWSKHGTCINTIKPSCYSNYSPQEEVGDFFQKVVDLFKGLDTYKVCVSYSLFPPSMAMIYLIHTRLSPLLESPPMNPRPTL